MKMFYLATSRCSLLAVLLLALGIHSSEAGSAKWRPSPTNNDWNTATNWQPATVPNGPSDSARFSVSNTTSISISANTEVSAIQFLPGASVFAISPNLAITLTLSGTGIINNSGVTQNLVTSSDEAGNFALINFTNNATAGSLTTVTNNGPGGSHMEGQTQFFDTSRAGNAVIINNSSTVSGFFGGIARFFDNSTGDHGTFINNGATIDGTDGGQTQFSDNASAGIANITTNGATVPGGAADTYFFGTATAASATLTNNAGGITGDGGFTFFEDSFTAGSAILISNGATLAGAGGGTTSFMGTSSAGASTIIANGATNGGAPGDLFFFDNSTGATARIELLGNGIMDISTHQLPGVTIGSIEGTGVAELGGNNLTVGSSNRSTTFSGVLQDGGQGGGTGGSLTKIGSGTLTLAGSNTYTGATTVNGGTLLIKRAAGSGTGTGTVQINSGTLGGTGTIAGVTNVGTTPDMGAILSPGLNGLGALTIRGLLTFVNATVFKFEINSSTGNADRVIAKGVSIVGFSTFAVFSLVDLGNGTLAPGSVITVINNTAPTPFGGTFTNLPDGGTLTVGNNTYQADYQGGDGNDLTLTVEP
ncbi:MAG TPA: autotransporter-associated beta strand repeat-containing protein [Chthoniobacterales bacterium]|jgi:autotransporter-associated beta strand protein